MRFDDLREANASRVVRWHPKDGPQWSGADWMTATAGELGEAANIVKKLRRDDDGIKAANDPSRLVLLSMLAEELADTICYLDLVALHYGIDLGGAVVAKFNAVSRREGFPERLTDAGFATPTNDERESTR